MIDSQVIHYSQLEQDEAAQCEVITMWSKPSETEFIVI